MGFQTSKTLGLPEEQRLTCCLKKNEIEYNSQRKYARNVSVSCRHSTRLAVPPYHDMSQQFHCASSSKREIQLLKFSVNSGSIPSSANNMASTSPSMSSGPTSRRQLNPVAPSRRKPEQGHPRTTHMASSNRRAAVTDPSHPSATDTAKSNEDYRRRVYGFSYGESSSGSGEKTDDVKRTNASASELPKRGRATRSQRQRTRDATPTAPHLSTPMMRLMRKTNYSDEYEAFFFKDHQIPSMKTASTP